MALAEHPWAVLDGYVEAQSLARGPSARPSSTAHTSPRAPVRSSSTNTSERPPTRRLGRSPKGYRARSAPYAWPMAPRPSRRRFLRAVGAVAASGLAGCATRRAGPGRPTVTPAPVPSDRPTPTAGSPTARPPPSPDVLELEVRALSGFEVERPARLEISLQNAGDAMLTALDGPAHTVPFVDDDYVGTDWSGDPELLLVPDEAELTLDPAGADPGPIQTFLPSASTDGCWSVPFDWPADRATTSAVLHAIPLQAGERRRHEYSLYSLDGCTTGTFSFVNSFDLSVGDPPFGRDLHRARLGFDLALSDRLAPVVRVHDPVIGPAAGEE